MTEQEVTERDIVVVPEPEPPHKYADSTNPLRRWFMTKPKPMSQKDFATLAGIAPSYLAALLRDEDPPWPNRDVQRKIFNLTRGEVTPNHLAGVA